MIATIFIGSTLTSFGAEADHKVSRNYTEEICLSEVTETGEKLELIGRDYQNGDVEFIQVMDGKIVSEYYVDRSKHVINETLHKNGKLMHNQNAYEEAPNLEYVPPKYVSRAYANAGTIYWNWSNGSSSGVCGARISFDTAFNTKDQYNLNGRYQDLAALTSLIASVIALPASPASAVAKNALSYLGIASTAVGISIPNYYVSAISAKVTHKATDTNSSRSNSLSGTEYTVNQTGYAQKTYRTGNYYPTSSFANRDTVYANAMYHLLFSYPSYSIKSWNAG